MQRKYRLLLAALSVSAAAGVTTRIWAASASDNLRAAPAPVQLTVVKLAGANTIKEFDSEVVDGKTTYDLEYMIKGTSYAADIAPDGSIAEREVDVDLSFVPPNVLAAATKAHPDGKLSEASVVTAGDKMFYGIDSKVGTDTHEMDISADGTLIKDGIEPPETDDDEAKPAAPGAAGAKAAPKAEEKD